MKQMMLLIMIFLTGFAFLATTFAQDFRHNHQQVDPSKMHLLGSNSKLNGSTEITQQDVQKMWEKVKLGIQTVNQFWQVKFSQNGLSYRAPQVKYCPADHTIYFDAVFFVRVMKAIGQNLETDGDMAIIFILAHEWGHAAQGITKMKFQFSIQFEENADCTAGAFTRFASEQKWLEDGDLEEALTVLEVFGDQLPYGASGEHGSGEERIAKFKRGMRGGLVACGGFSR
jgi:predicted metalloprotease